MEKKFIEFLTKKFSRSEVVGKAYETDEEMIKHFLSGEVTIPITLALEFICSNSSLPSRFQINDLVCVKFKDFTITKAKVIKVHFTESKVLYDLQIIFSDESSTSTRIYNVDSFIMEEYSH